MSSSEEAYQSPLTHRYSSVEMSFLFSKKNRAILFRKLWLQLAIEQKKLGIAISSKQIKEMEENVSNIDFQRIYAIEKQTKHDVMAHILAFGEKCPEAKSIIHLGATSCFVTDNADLIILKEGLILIQKKLFNCLKLLGKIAEKYANLSCVSFTHFQPAQPTTMGKRFCLWLQDFIFDYEECIRLLETIPFLGAKGATGSQASFFQLFEKNHEKVKTLDTNLAKSFHFSESIMISSQTYTRKIDIFLLNFLASFASSCHKMATDIRLLSNTGEIRETFGKNQVGSSAMPYKKNPIYSERICGLARYLISLAQNPLFTHSTQWLERSLDDSSNRRLTLPESFLTADALLNLLEHVLGSIDVDKKQIHENLEKNLPFFVMEAILMFSTKKGKNRQDLHEKLRKLSQESPEEFLKKIPQDASFSITLDEINELSKPEFLTGRSKNQVYEFLKEKLEPILKKHQEIKSSFKIEV